MPRLRYRLARLALQTLLRTLGEHLRAVLALLIVCVSLVFAVWTWTLADIARDKQHIRDELRKTASADASAYASQLARSMRQVDFIMLSQKYQWEKVDGRVDLDQQRRAGLLPPSSDLIVTLVDAQGNPVTSTLPFKNNRTNIASRSYFLEHKESSGLGMTVSRPSIGLRLGREVIMLTRRLDLRNGSFGGLIVVAIEPSFLGSNLGSAALEQGDLVAAYRSDWTFLAGNAPTVGMAPGVRARSPLRGDQGTIELDGDHYKDGLARVVAWRKVEGYPLIAAVALCEQWRLDSYNGREHELRLLAGLASGALLALAGCALAYLLCNASRELHRHEVRQPDEQANVDALTRLPNRLWLTRQLPAALERARRAESALAVLFLDLDDFRNLNETQGHAIGDELLRAVARRLQGQLGEDDGVARLGGDEFTVILHAPGGDARIVAVAQRITEQLREPFVIGSGMRYAGSASIGISVFPRDGEDGATLLKHADIAMYAAKDNGKGHFRFYDAHMSERLVKRLG
jgi:diguanylate cyclase (GGDEF)-like protein